jgi:DNA mismatch endonuclease (patch repair protein)
MADTFDPAARSEIMRRVLSENTTPEMEVRRALHAAGIRFRLHRKDLPGKPDLVLPRHRIALFVHGCFWHWHGCKRSRMPQDNREYWTAKIDRNVERDKANRARLEQLGWRVRIIWECALSDGIAELMGEIGK